MTAAVVTAATAAFNEVWFPPVLEVDDETAAAAAWVTVPIWADAPAAETALTAAWVTAEMAFKVAC